MASMGFEYGEPDNPGRPQGEVWDVIREFASEGKQKLQTLF